MVSLQIGEGCNTDILTVLMFLRAASVPRQYTAKLGIGMTTSRSAGVA